MANKRIAGITIEIGGDTTKLQSSLKGVDSTLSKTQSNLKDINKLLKLDPSNTKLLTQKQKELKTAIGSTKDRLKQLKEAQKQVGKGTAEYDKLQREIIETEQNLKGLKKEYKDFGSVAKQQLKNIQSKMKNIGEKVTGFGTAWTKYVTAPIAALGGLSYKAFTEVDEGLDTITKKTGATGEQLDELGGIMENIATTIPTDFKTAGDAVGEVNTRFGLTGKELEDLSGKFIKFAALNDTDVSTSIDSVQAAMAQFGVSTDKAGDVLDILNKAAQNTGIPVDQLSSSLLANGTALQEMGFRIGPAIGLLSSLEKNGIDSGTAMAGFKKAMANATKEGKPLKTELANIEAAMLGASTQTEAAQIATELFGSKAGPAIAQAVREGRLSLDELSNQVGEWGGNIEQTFDATLDPADQFNTALNNLKLLGADIAKQVMPILTDALTAIQGVITTVREKWDGLTDSQKENILKIVGIVAAIGPLTTVLGTVITLLSGPAGIVVAIGAVVAAGVYLVTHWDEVKEKAAELWEKVKKWFADMGKKAGELWESIKKAFTDGWNAIKKIDWAAVGKAMWDKIKAAFATVKTWFKDKFDAVKAAISKIDWAALGKTLWTGITSAFDTVKTWFKDKFDAVVTALSKIDWAGLGTMIWDGVTSMFDDVVTWFSDKFDAAWTAISEIDWAALGDLLWGGITSLFDDVGSWFEDRFNEAWDLITAIDWGGIATTIWDCLVTGLDGIGEWLLGVFKTPINAIIDAVNWMIGGVEGAVNGVIGGINKALSLNWNVTNPFTGGSLFSLKWSPNLKKVSWGRLEKLANGGILGEGGRAIVGEYAPEYLTVKNGQAVVTPIPGAERWGGGDTITNNITINQLPGENANELANRVIRIMTRQQEQRVNAYA